MSEIVSHPSVAFASLVLGFGFLIFVHELGHFLVAKWVGIRCTQFAIGFGPSMIAYRRGIGFRLGTTEPDYEKRIAEGADPDSMDETEYRLNYFPLGGYVKMLGQEDMDATATSEDPRSYTAKPIWARMCVISAGVVMNMIFGLIFFVVAFMAGVDFPSAVVGGTADESPAATTYAVGHENDKDYLGLKPGDRIASIDGQPIHDMTEVRIATALAGPDSTLTMSIERPGLDQPLTYKISPKPSPIDGLLSAGIIPSPSLTVAKRKTPEGKIVPGIGADSQAAKDGVTDGMTITAINGEPIERYHQFIDAAKHSNGQPLTVTFTHDKRGQAVDTVMVPSPALSDALTENGPRHLLGLVPATRGVPTGKHTPAARAGMQDGDVLARIATKPWPHVRSVIDAVASTEGAAFEIDVWRDGEIVTLTDVRPNASGLIGVALSPYIAEPIIGHVLPDSPLSHANIPAGSVVQSVNGKPVANWSELQQALSASLAGSETSDLQLAVTLNIADKPTELISLELTDTVRTQMASAIWGLPTNIDFDMLTVEVVAGNPVAATALGLEKTKQFILQTYVTLLRLFQGTVKPSHLRGPVGIVDEGTRVAQRGWPYLLFFLGLISINLAVLNFLPIPVVDGGHMVLLIIEKIKGSPASPAIQQAAMLAGLAVLGLVFIIVTYNDISRLVSRFFA